MHENDIQSCWFRVLLDSWGWCRVRIIYIRCAAAAPFCTSLACDTILLKIPTWIWWLDQSRECTDMICTLKQWQSVLEFKSSTCKLFLLLSHSQRQREVRPSLCSKKWQLKIKYKIGEILGLLESTIFFLHNRVK